MPASSVWNPVFVRGARQLGGSGTKDEKEEDDDDYFGEEALAHRTRQWLPKDVHSVGRKYSGPLSAAGGGPSTAASSAAASRRAANTAMLGQETAARQFTSIVSSPTANFLLAGAASTQDPGLYLLQNESYKEDVTAPLSVDDVSALDQTTPVYDIAWQSGTVVGASANGVVRLWTLDPSNRVQTTATFLHSVRKSTGGGGAGPAMSAPPPGSMYNDRRVLKVRLIGKESSQMASVDADAISLWDISHPETPVYSEKQTANAVSFTCMDNSPFLPKGVAVGASDGSATMIDTLAPTQSATGRLSFKPTGLARSPLRAVAFSPHAPYWLATAGSDAVVRVWDTRYNGRPMRELFGHTVGVTSLAWSPMHSEWLLSGSLDQSMRLWSLNVTSPTTQAMSGQIAYCTQGLISGVKSVTFCNKTPNLAVALSMNGNLTTMRCSPSFEASVASHRYSEEKTKDAYLVERAVYLRDMADATKRALEVSQNTQSNRKARMIIEMVRLCVPLPSKQPYAEPTDQPAVPQFLQEARIMPQSDTADQLARRRFENELFEFTYYVPGDVHYRSSETTDELLKQLLLQQRGNVVLESIESGKKQDVMNQLNGFVKDLQSNIHAYDVKLLQDIFEFIKGDELTKAYKFGLDVVNEFKKQNLFASALPLVHSILFPTIFDAPEHQDATPTKVPLGSMISFKSLSTLCPRNPPRSIWSAHTSQDETNATVDRLRSELTNGDVVFPMLQVLYNLSNHNDEINNPTDKDLDKLVGSMKGKSHYGSTFIRYYLSALIRLDQFEDYYREASKLVKNLGPDNELAKNIQIHSASGAFNAMQEFFTPVLEGSLVEYDLLEDMVMISANLLLLPNAGLPEGEVSQFVQQILRLSGTQYVRALARLDDEDEQEEGLKRCKVVADELARLKRASPATSAGGDVQHVLDRLTKFIKSAQ